MIKLGGAAHGVPAYELGVATSAITFFRGMGGAVGVSALGAVLAGGSPRW